MTGIVMVKDGLAARYIVQDALTEYFPSTWHKEVINHPPCVRTQASRIHPVKAEVKEWGTDLDNPMTF